MGIAALYRCASLLRRRPKSVRDRHDNPPPCPGRASECIRLTSPKFGRFVDGDVRDDTAFTRVVRILPFDIAAHSYISAGTSVFPYAEAVAGVVERSEQGHPFLLFGPKSRLSIIERAKASEKLKKRLSSCLHDAPENSDCPDIREHTKRQARKLIVLSFAAHVYGDARADRAAAAARLLLNEFA